MLKVYKFRMYPNKEQENILKQFIGTSRFIYNNYLYEKETEYKVSFYNYPKYVNNI